MISNRMDINRVLAEMREIKSQVQFPNAGESQGIDQPANQLKELKNLSAEKSDGFGQLMNQAINNVNELQKTSGDMRTAYEIGKPGVDITDVMIASQKASVSFQALTQVRNKLVEAYKDVMNMPI